MKKFWNFITVFYVLIGIFSILYLCLYTKNECMRNEIICVTLYDVAIGIFSAVLLAFVIEIAAWRRMKLENKEKFIYLNLEIEREIYWLLTAYTRIIRKCDEIIEDEVNNSLMEYSFDTLEEYLSMLNKKAKVIKDNIIQTLHASYDVCADLMYEKRGTQLMQAIEDERLKKMYKDLYNTLNKSLPKTLLYSIYNLASNIDIDFPRNMLSYFPMSIESHNPNAVILSEKTYFDSTVEIFEGLVGFLKMYKDNKNSFYYKYLNERKCYTENGLFYWSRKEKNQKNKEKQS